MRQLFLPVCLCVVTWSGATGSNPRMTLDEFSQVKLAKQGQIASGHAAIRQEETASAVVKIPDDAAPVADAKKPPPDVAEIAALIPDLAAEFPVPSGVVVNGGIPIGIPLPPVPKPVIARSEDEICNALTAAAQQNDVPAPFFIRLLFQESRFRPEVVSHAGAQGIAQFMPGTADQMGLENPFDPVQAIPASARLLRDLVKQFGNLGLAAAAYNAGPKRVADWLAAKGKSKLPDETQGYVKTITGKPVENWSVATARHPAQKLPEKAPCQDAAGLLAAAGPDDLPLPTPSPLRASGKMADKDSNKGGDKKQARAETPSDAKATEQANIASKNTGKKPVKEQAKEQAKDQAKEEAKSEPRKDLPRREKIAQR